MLVYREPGVELFRGQSETLLRSFPENSAGSLVTDPPGGVGSSGHLGDGFDPEFLRQIDNQSAGRQGIADRPHAGVDIPPPKRTARRATLRGARGRETAAARARCRREITSQE